MSIPDDQPEPRSSGSGSPGGAAPPGVAPSPAYGRDEMNLAEFPFATLAHRPDQSRNQIVHETWVTERDGTRRHQKWIAGGGPLGLPTEMDERVYIALMKITYDQGFKSRKVSFSIYQVLKIMGVGTSKARYEEVEQALERLVGVTIYAKSAFWDQAGKQWRMGKGFHLIESSWLRSEEEDPAVRQAEGVPAYIVWSEEVWKNLQAGYIKRLDLDFFFGLKTPLSRRLYRFLDKRMHYQDTYEIDVFELAGRLGMARYKFPAHVHLKLQSAFDELIERGWLESATTVKRQGYSRFRFVRPGGEVPPADREPLLQAGLPSPEEEADPLEAIWAQALSLLAQSMTRATYEAHFPRTRLVEVDADRAIATVEVGDAAGRDWLSARLSRPVREALLQAGADVAEVVFVLPGAAAEQD